MRKLGKFKGLPVYTLSEGEWQSMNTREEETFYVVNNNVYYHDVKIATLNEYGQLCGLDEDEVISLRKRYDAMRAEEVAAVRSVATFKSDVETVRSPINDAGDAPAAAREEFDIDEFLKVGLFDVDGYIKNMLAADLNVEVPEIAVG